ncbi:MAG: glycosyltransferase [Verrucomicrobiae bacterium]|nr:glycosyltransferase [Verrucomicrobiae bacterium]
MSIGDAYQPLEKSSNEMTSPFLSIIIPARNEADRLPKTIGQLQDFFQYHSWPLEIIPVIQGNDETATLICKLAQKDPRIKPIIDSQGGGKGRAVRYGVEQAQGEVILFIDADLSVPPHCLIKLLEQFQTRPLSKLAAGDEEQEVSVHRRGAYKEILDEASTGTTQLFASAVEFGRRSTSTSCDILIGSRQHPKSNITHPQPWHRRFLGRVFNLFLRSIRLTKFRDTQCGCKFFRHDVAKTLFSYAMVNGFAFDVEILLLAKNLGYHVEEAPVEWANGGHSRFGISNDGMQALEDVWNLTEYS